MLFMSLSILNNVALPELSFSKLIWNVDLLIWGMNASFELLDFLEFLALPDAWYEISMYHLNCFNFLNCLISWNSPMIERDVIVSVQLPYRLNLKVELNYSTIQLLRRMRVRANMCTWTTYHQSEGEREHVYMEGVPPEWGWEETCVYGRHSTRVRVRENM